jgi:hypothetical protein
MHVLELLPRGRLAADVLPLLVTGLTEADVLRRQGAGGAHSPGFLLVRDTPRRTLVLAIRGSLSLADLVTDLTCRSADCSNIFSSVTASNLAKLRACTSSTSTSTSDERRAEGLGEEEVHYAHEGFLLAANELDASLQVGLEGRGRRLICCGHSVLLHCTVTRHPSLSLSLSVTVPGGGSAGPGVLRPHSLRPRCSCRGALPAAHLRPLPG